MTTAKRSGAKPPSKPDAAKLPVAKTYVDLSKLRKTSLKRYKKHFNLDVKADSKTELLEAVGRHFAAMPVREADVALEFHNFARTLRTRRAAATTSVMASPAITTNARTSSPVRTTTDDQIMNNGTTSSSTFHNNHVSNGCISTANGNPNDNSFVTNVQSIPTQLGHHGHAQRVQHAHAMHHHHGHHHHQSQLAHLPHQHLHQQAQAPPQQASAQAPAQAPPPSSSQEQQHHHHQSLQHAMNTSARVAVASSGTQRAPLPLLPAAPRVHSPPRAPPAAAAASGGGGR